MQYTAHCFLLLWGLFKDISGHLLPASLLWLFLHFCLSAHPKWNTTNTSCIFPMCCFLPTMSSQVGVFSSSVTSSYQGGHDHYDNASCRPPAPGLQPLHLEIHQCCTEATTALLSCSHQGLHQREASEAPASGTKLRGTKQPSNKYK